MKKLIYLKYITLVFYLLLLSCGQNFNPNPAYNQSSTDTTIEERLLGSWVLPDASGNPNKALTYIFEHNNICQIFSGQDEIDLTPNSFIYQIEKNNGVNRVTIKNNRNENTVFRITRIDESNMHVIFELIDNTKQRFNTELIMKRTNTTEGY